MYRCTIRWDYSYYSCVLLVGTQSKVHQRSAWWAFNIVNNWANLMFSTPPGQHSFLLYSHYAQTVFLIIK